MSGCSPTCPPSRQSIRLLLGQLPHSQAFELENHRERTKDAYVVGTFELPELQKRLAGIEGELSVLHRLLGTAGEPVEVDPELVSEVARVFVRWPRLRREEKRDLLLAYRIQAFISRPERGVLQIEHIDIGAAGFPSGVRIFKERHPSDGKP